MRIRKKRESANQVWLTVFSCPDQRLIATRLDMTELDHQEISEGKMRVLRIAHASLTPTLRERERALARGYPDVDLELVTTDHWREAEVEVQAAEDDLFPVIKARPR